MTVIENNFKEEWKLIAGYNRYQVSNFGRVRNIMGLILNQNPHYKGEMRIQLYNDDGRRDFRVHRLVATAFIPNPEDLPLVNHKDLNKKNNHHTNLEWSTYSENTQHYFDNRDSIGERLGMAF